MKNQEKCRAIKGKRINTFLLMALFAVTTATAQQNTATQNTEAQNMYRDIQAEIPASEHGGYVSMGFSLLGGGLVGFDMKVHPTKWLALEAGVSYRPAIVSTKTISSGYYGESSSSSKIKWTHGAMITAGPTFYFSKGLNRYKTKVLAHGLFIKGGYGAGVLKESMFAMGWSRERYLPNRPGSSYTFQLGAGFTRLLGSSIPVDTYGLLGGSYSPMLFIKFKWNFYVGKYKRG